MAAASVMPIMSHLRFQSTAARSTRLISSSSGSGAGAGFEDGDAAPG